MRLHHSKLFLWWLILWLGSVGCQQPRREIRTMPNIDSLQVQSGDVIFRLGSGIISDFFRQFASSQQRYSHSGIIIADENGCWVVHAEIDETKGINGVYKQPLADFVTDSKNFQIYHLHLPTSKQHALKDYLNRLLATPIPFDTKMNSQDSSQLYCTELVANCLNFLADEPNEKVKPTLCPPMKKDYLIYSLDDIEKAIHRRSQAE